MEDLYLLIGQTNLFRLFWKPEYPGAQGGIAVADVLFGDYNPGGKLTVTFPKSVGQIPFNFPAKPASQVDGGTPKRSNGEYDASERGSLSFWLWTELYDI